MPVFRQRPIEDFPIGNLPVAGHHQALAREGLHCHPHAWLTAADLRLLSPAGPSALVDAKGTPLAWYGAYPDLDRSRRADSSME